MLDIFRGDAFGVIPSDARHQQSEVRSRLHVRARGCLAKPSTASTVVSIEEKNNILTLVAPTPRGGPGHDHAKAPALDARARRSALRNQ